VQHGDPSIAHERHVDTLDRGRLFRNAQVKGEEPQIAADVNWSRSGEDEIG
jgi:hypothetical protein